MTRIILVLLLVVAAGAVVAAPTAHAAENTTDGNESATEVERHDFEEAVDSQVTVTGWEYDEVAERFTITLEVNTSTTVGITEGLSLDSAGSEQINVWQELLEPGTHEVEFTARTGANSEAVAIISTHRSSQDGTAVVLSTGHVSDNPFQHFGGASGLLTGIVMTTLIAVGGAVYVVRKEASGVVRAEP